MAIRHCMMLLLGLFLTAHVCAEPVWIPVRDVSLIVEPDSILDLSAMVEAGPVDSGRLLKPLGGEIVELRNLASPQRFLMASLGFSMATGGMPDHTMAELYVKQVRMHGYNMVRLDFVEETLMTGRVKDFDFNPEQFDRFHYLLAALRREGIYYILNGLSSDNGAYGNVDQRWLNQRGLKRRLFFDYAAQTHWKDLMRHMLGATNPYTGTTVLDDPALAGLIMVNEGGLAFLTRNGTPDELRPLFSDWLRKKYGTTAMLAKAWRGELASTESLESANVRLPKPDAWTGARMSDAQRFYAELEKSTAEWMSHYLRGLGFKGMLTAYNNWLSPAAHASRGQLEWVDLHNYFSEPTQFVAKGSVMRQDSMLEGDAKYIRELAIGRHIGKPFTVSEYGQIFWNRYRRESALAVPAYAAFQGWGMVCQHAGAIDLSYAASGGRKDAIYPFSIGLDPVARAGETLAALLYLRGDVAPSLRMVGVKLDARHAFDQQAFLGDLPADVSRLSLLAGIGLDWEGRQESGYDVQISPDSLDLRIIGQGVRKKATETTLTARIGSLAAQYAGKLGPKIAKTNVVANERWANRVSKLKAAGVLPEGNLTDPDEGRFQTDNGQILLDARKKQLRVVTPNTEAVVFDHPEPISLDQLSVDQADGPALISVSSMDGQPIKASKRMLLILATDARNSGMRFSDAAETTLLDLGKKPVLIKTAVVRLKLKNQHAAKLKVYSNTLRGKRGDVIPVVQESDGISFVLDTAKLSHGPTTYFEISGQD